MTDLRLILFSFASINILYFAPNCDSKKINILETIVKHYAESGFQSLPLTYESLSFIFGPDWETQLEAELQLKATDELLALSDIVTKNGYPVETHKIRTLDDYILTLHRIPHGKQSDSKTLENKPVILLQHGLLQSSDDWFRNEAENFLPLLLADANFDVWVANSRGNKYSNEHLTLEEDTLEFYDFSFHEMGQYDIPATIDFILETTKQRNLNYIGCSVGTTVFYVTMSIFPEYNDKVNFMASLSPVAFLTHTTSPVKTLAPYTDELKGLFVTLRTKRFNPPKLQSIVNTYLPRLCFFRLVSRGLCNSVNKVLKDFGMSKFESHHVQQLSKFAPTTTSIKTMIHFLQLIKGAEFQQYDHGSEQENKNKYGMKNPPAYNLTNVNIPIAIFSGVNDAFSHEQDVELLKTSLPNVVAHTILNSTFKTHVDYTHEPKAVELIYNPLIALLSVYNNNTQFEMKTE